MLIQHVMAEAYNRLSYYGHYAKSPSYFIQSTKGAILGRLARLGLEEKSLHSCICWVCEDRNFHTRVFLFNYWSETYGVSDVMYELSLHDRDGRQVHSWETPMRPKETKCVDVAAVVGELRIKTPFEGNLIVRTRNLASRRWVQIRANVDYYGDNFVTTVHDQGWLMNYKMRYAVSVAPVVDNELFETSLVLLNCFDYRQDSNELVSRPRIQVLGPEGERSAWKHLPPVKACGARHIEINQAFPSLRKMLRGQQGALRLSGVNLGRPLFFIREKKTGQCWVDHGFHDQTIPSRILSRTTRQITGGGPILTALALEGENIHTRYTFFNNLGFTFDYNLRLCLFGADGEKILDIPNLHQWGPYETKVVHLRDLLNGRRLPDRFVGHIRVSLAEDSKHRFYPMSFYVVPELFNSEANQGWALGNALYNSGLRRKYLFEPPRTRVFSRVVLNEEYKTSVFLINASTRFDYRQQANPVVTLFDGSGSHSMETQLTIPPHGSVLFDVEEVFPGARQFLEKSDGVGQIGIQDKSARLSGGHLLGHRSGGVPAIDHLIGG